VAVNLSVFLFSVHCREDFVPKLVTPLDGDGERPTGAGVLDLLLPSLASPVRNRIQLRLTDRSVLRSGSPSSSSAREIDEQFELSTDRAIRTPPQWRWLPRAARCSLPPTPRTSPGRTRPSSAGGSGTRTCRCAPTTPSKVNPSRCIPRPDQEDAIAARVIPHGDSFAESLLSVF
jgi:hypothetical protein